MLHMPSPMLLQAADGADPRAEAYIAAVGTFTAARAAIVRKLFADMGAVADKLRFLYLCAAHDQTAATRNVMDPASNPLSPISNFTSGVGFAFQADRYIACNQDYYYDEFGDQVYFLIYPTYTYGSRATGLGGSNLFVGNYLAPRTTSADGRYYFQGMNNPPAAMYHSNGTNAAKRTSVTWPGQGTVYHGSANTTTEGGLVAVGRSGAQSVGWVDGVPANSPQTTGVPSINFGQAGARGYVSASSLLRVSVHCLGDVLADAEVITLNTAFRNYLAAIGAPLA